MKMLTPIAVAALLVSPAFAEEATKKPGVISPSQLAHKSARVAAVQITGPWNWQVPTTAENDTAAAIVPYIDRAGKDGADLVVFPELYLGMFRVPSPQTDAISEAAKRNKIHVMVGCFEITNEKGDYGNSTLIFDREGKIVGRYFKAYQAVGGAPYSWPPVANDPEWMMTPGEECPVFDLDFGRVGILTCYDGYFPEIFRVLSLKGAEIIIWPNARHGSVEDYIVRANVHQNYVHMVATNKAIGAGTMIAEWPHGLKQQITEPKESYIIADLNLAQLRNSRVNAREFRQRRPAMFGDLTKDWSISENYGVDEADLEVPPPSQEAKDKLLKRLGISAQP